MTDFLDHLRQVLVGSTIVTLKVQCGLEVAHVRSFVKGQEKQELPFEIGALIGITSTAMRGSVALCFSESVFKKVLGNLVHERVTEVNSENQDAAAEILNIIFSQSKTELNKKGFAVQIAIPTVLRGSHIQASYQNTQPIFVLVFKIGDEEFYIELITNPTLDAALIDHTEGTPTPLKTPPHPSAAPIKAKAIFLTQFVISTVTIFKIQFSLEVKAGKPYEKAQTDPMPFDIAGVIGLTSNTVNGSYLLVFKQDVFLKLASRIFQEEVTTLNIETADIVAEAANIALGSAKTILNQQGHGIQMAIPTIIRGGNVVSSFSKARKAIVVPFESEIGPFHVEIDIED